MKLKIYLLLTTIALTTPLLSKDDKNIAFTINGKPTYKQELQNAYTQGQSIALEKESFNSFLDSYIFHKLNITEALEQGFDTTRAYRRDMGSYKVQLTKSFLADTASIPLLKEKWLARFSKEVEVNQLFIPFSKEVILPQDTIVQYKKALGLREQAIKNGFANVEVEKMINPFGIRADVEKESGYLGWIRPFMFSKELDDQLFSLKLMEVSQPIRSPKGYHILQVKGEREPSGGAIIEQVMFNFPEIPASKHIKDSVYNVAIRSYDEVTIRDNFQDLCDEFAEVFQLGEKGCLLGVVDISSTLPTPIIQAALNMNTKGEISKVVETNYAYHILRLKEKLPPMTELDKRKVIDTYLASGNGFIEILNRERDLKIKRNKAVVNKKVYKYLVDFTATQSPNDSLFAQSATNTDRVLVSLDNNKKTYTAQDFLDFVDVMRETEEPEEDQNTLSIVRYENMIKNTLSTDIFTDRFDGFMYYITDKYEKETLLEKDPRFASAMKKLSDGLLQTLIMDKEIWRKSKVDATGLEKTFEQNKAKYSLVGKPYKGMVVLAKDESVIEEIEKLYAKEKLSAKELKSRYNAENFTIQIEAGTWLEGENVYVDSAIYGKGEKPSRRNLPYSTVLGDFITTPQDYTDVKAEVEKDYLDKLDKEWKDYLNNKFVVEINNDVIKTIK